MRGRRAQVLLALWELAASLILTVAFSWAVIAGWDDVPTALSIASLPACLTWIVRGAGAIARSRRTSKSPLERQ